MLTASLSKLAEMASTFAGKLVTFTWSAVTVLPEVLLFVIFMIMESYYIVVDTDENDNFAKKWLPARVMSGYVADQEGHAPGRARAGCDGHRPDVHRYGRAAGRLFHPGGSSTR